MRRGKSQLTVLELHWEARMKVDAIALTRDVDAQSQLGRRRPRRYGETQGGEAHV